MQPGSRCRGDNDVIVAANLRGGRDHADNFSPFLGESFQGYAAAMAREGTWGDELTLVRLPVKTVSIHDMPPISVALFIIAELIGLIVDEADPWTGVLIAVRQRSSSNTCIGSTSGDRCKGMRI